MKKFLLFIVGLACMLPAQAQITTGESTAQKIRTGNRAEQGDFGLYLGMTTTMFKNMTDNNIDFSALPLLNFKYMTSDNVEARIGFEWWSKNNSDTQEENKKDATSATRETNIMFYPGIAYHFNRSNILDVYVGGELPIGGGANASSAKYDGKDLDDASITSTRFEIGVGAFIGLQAYICNLPLAVGVEYGFNFRNCHLSNGILSQDGFKIETSQKHLSSNRFVLGNQARLTVTYFFKL